MKSGKLLSIATIIIIFFMSCNNLKETKEEMPAIPKLKAENVNYQIDSLNMIGYIVYDENIIGARPAVIVVPEWWGLNDYAKRRARELAELGYTAMAIDMYGDGKTADNPQDAGTLATPFYQNPAMAKSHFDAALTKLKSYEQTDDSNIAAIGYCFGGAMVLNMARMGEDLKGVISFHGNLQGVPLNKDLLKAKVLVLHGADDKFVPETEVAQFKHQMDSIGANYKFISYEGSTHAFTNPDATANGEKFGIPIAYNAAADTASFAEMKLFLSELFK